MSEKTTIYCDESGNDGPNYLNPHQPFYVLAGWAVPDGAIVDAAVAIELARQRYCRDADELKFKTFKKSEGKREALISLVCELGQLGLVPVFLFAEKRFCIAGKIVETFLDPWYNPLVRNGFTWDAQTKQELANTFYDVLPDSTLRTFAEAYQKPTESTLTGALLAVIEESRNRVNPELAAFLEGSRAEMPAIVQAEIVAAESYEKAGGTLNFPCLVSFLMLVENLARKNTINPHRIVHDEQGPYQAGYLQVFQHHRSDKDFSVTMDGQDIPYGTLRAIKSFEIQRSVDQPLIQAADLLAGAINHTCTKLQTGSTLTDGERRLAQYSLPLMLVPKIQLAYPICSDQMLRRIGSLFHEMVGVSTSHRQRAIRQPVFPVLNSVKTDTHRFPITLPLFGVGRASDGALQIVLPPDRTLQETDTADAFIALFTDERAAVQYLTEEQDGWTEAHELQRFEVAELPELLEQIAAWKEYAKWIMLNPFSEKVGRIEIGEFVETMHGMLDRIIRAFRTGAASSMFQSSILDGREAISVLLSTGTYGAAWKDDPSCFRTGTSRAAALDSLQRAVAKNA